MQAPGALLLETKSHHLSFFLNDCHLDILGAGSMGRAQESRVPAGDYGGPKEQKILGAEKQTMFRTKG